jgi:DNA-binding SARP family transcriptional activator
VALYRGEFLEDMAFTGEEWCSLRREELEGRFLAALQALGDLRMARKAYAEALEAYRKLLARDPLREEAHRAVMRCLALMGDRNAALRHYQSMAALLYDELGVEPGAETVELYRQLAAGAEPAGPRGLRAGSPS